MKVFLIFGPPGAGKGTQGEALDKKNLVKHLSTGEVLRRNIQDQTSIGLEAKKFMDQGRLVPDHVLDPMIKEFIDHYDSSKPIMLDGYPRTIEQAKYLVSVLEPLNSLPIEVINFSLPDSVLVQRLLKRGRADDTEETIKVRLQVYKTQTEPLIELFEQYSSEKKAIVHNVDGNQSIDEVLSQVERIVSK